MYLYHAGHAPYVSRWSVLCSNQNFQSSVLSGLNVLCEVLVLDERKQSGTVSVVYRATQQVRQRKVVEVMMEVTHHPACISQISNLHSQFVCILRIQRTEDEI